MRGEKLFNFKQLRYINLWYMVFFSLTATRSCHFCTTHSTCTSQHISLLWVNWALRPSSCEVNRSICLYCQTHKKPNYWRSLAWFYPGAFCDLTDIFPELTHLLRACTCAKCLCQHIASCLLLWEKFAGCYLRRIGTIHSCALIGIVPNLFPIIFTPEKPTQSPAHMLANNNVVLSASLLRRQKAVLEVKFYPGK